MLDVLKTIQDEVVDDKFVATCKDFTEKMGGIGSLVFVCNVKLAVKHLMSFKLPFEEDLGSTRPIRCLAQKFRADAIITMIATDEIEGQVYMTLTIETLMERQTMAFPYERKETYKVEWGEQTLLELPPRFVDLLPTPAGMASA